MWRMFDCIRKISKCLEIQHQVLVLVLMILKKTNEARWSSTCIFLHGHSQVRQTKLFPSPNVHITVYCNTKQKGDLIGIRGLDWQQG